MTTSNIGRKNYYGVDLEPGVEYLWCAFGYSVSQLFCDDSHEGIQLHPKPIKVREAMSIYLCGCKFTTDALYCDGSHVGL